MKAEKKNDNIKQFSIILNNAIDKQLSFLASRRQETKAKVIKRLINNAYLDYVTSQR